MSFAEFQEAMARGAEPPVGASGALAALWWDGRGDWQRAHECAQADAGRDGAWVHAYLHRKEGDEGNSAYWYVRAGRRMPARATSFAEEWEDIARELAREAAK